MDTEHWRHAIRNWQSRLAIAVAGFLLFETLSGLAIFLLPFSVSNQVNVIVHTVVGMIFLIPCGWYLIRHFLEYRRNNLSHIVVMGYLGTAAIPVCLVSGVVLTIQAVFGSRISYGWDLVHIVSTFATMVFVLFHIVPLVIRDRRQQDRVPQTLPAAVGAYGKATAWFTVACAGVIAIGWLAYRPPSFQTEFPEDYSLKYGLDRPFAPSLARTENSGPMDSRLLSGSETCGTAGCHTEIVEEWKVSSHRWAAMDAGFQKIQGNMAQQNGPESTRYCGGCHDPISLFSGTKNLFIDDAELTSLVGYQDGIACLVCHSVREVDVKGNANYVVAAPARYLFEIEYAESPSKAARLVRDFLIRAYPRQHVSELSKRFFKAPEYCAACHKQFIDKEINKVGWVQLQNQYDNWRQSRWNHPGDARKTIECRECHMPLTVSKDPAAGDGLDYNRTTSDGRHRSHRFLGSNQFMPTVLKLPGAEEQVALTEQWLQGKIEIPEIADKWSAGPIVALELIAPETVRPGGEVSLKVVITSNKVGHDFPTGPLDIIQAWIELVVKDDLGNDIYTSGSVDAKGFIQQGTFMLKADPVDESGNLIDRHNLWEMVGVRFRRALFPGFSDTTEYSFFCPEVARPDARKQQPEKIAYQIAAPKGGARSLEITARLRYRKISQYLLNFMFGEESGLSAPITDLSSDSRIVAIERGTGRSRSGG